MQINLPIHEVAGHKVFFDAIDAFALDHQATLVHIQHLQDAIDPNDALGDTRKKAIPIEIIQSIHVQLG